jgi:hypothetical protein
VGNASARGHAAGVRAIARRSPQGFGRTFEVSTDDRVSRSGPNRDRP